MAANTHRYRPLFQIVYRCVHLATCHYRSISPDRGPAPSIPHVLPGREVGQQRHVPAHPAVGPVRGVRALSPGSRRPSEGKYSVRRPIQPLDERVRGLRSRGGAAGRLGVHVIAERAGAQALVAAEPAHPPSAPPCETPHTIIQRGGAHGAVVAQPALVVVVLGPELNAGGVLALVALKVPAARAGEVAACEMAGWPI